MFDLNPQERKAVIFLFLVASVGFAFDLFSKSSPKLKSRIFAQQGLETLDLNSAGKEELMSLPGIGEKLALRILDYRSENGNFTSPDELKEIKGITGYRYRKLRDSVSVQ